jgi:hypothetical protein
VTIRKGHDGDKTKEGRQEGRNDGKKGGTDERTDGKAEGCRSEGKGRTDISCRVFLFVIVFWCGGVFYEVKNFAEEPPAREMCF